MSSLGSSSPAAVSQQLHFLLQKGAVEDASLLYEEDALFVELDGVSRGRKEIAAAHQRFIDAGLRVRLVDHVMYIVDDLALIHWSWIVESETGVFSEGVSAEVLRRQPDGSWLFVIDNSDGADMLDTGSDTQPPA